MTTPTAKDAATELKREIYQRSRVYPRWVADGRLEQAESDRRAARMAKALEIVEAAAAQEKAAGDLFGDAASPSDVTDTLLELTTDLQHMQTRAHALGLPQTARALNEAMNKAGWEQAEKDAQAKRLQKDSAP